MPRFIAVVSPVLPGRRASLEAIVSHLPTGERSPLATVPGIHYGRWLIVTRMGGELLSFSAVSDSPPRDFFRLLREHMADVVDEVWSHCTGWPGTRDEAAMETWMEARTIDASLRFGTWHAAVDEIRAALRRRAQVLQFAVAHQSLAPAALQRAFFQEFGP